MSSSQHFREIKARKKIQEKENMQKKYWTERKETNLLFTDWTIMFPGYGKANYK